MGDPEMLSFKPIFHRKKHLRWLPNVNEIYTDNMKCMCDLYSTDLRWVLRIGGNTNFSIRIGDNANFSIFRYQHVGIPNAKFRIWGIVQREVLLYSGI